MAGDGTVADRLAQSVDKLEGRRVRLLDEYRHQQEAVGRIETELREAGVDPEALSHKAVLKMGRQFEVNQTQARAWRTEPATERQLDTLAAMLDRRGMPRELLDAPLTKGEADQAIKAALDGRQPALSWPRGEVTSPFVVAAKATSPEDAPPVRDREPVPAAADPAASEPIVEDPRTAVIAAVVERAAADEGLNLVAAATSNTHAQYFGWAVQESKSRALAALADLMDEGDQPTRLAARTLLADGALWSEVPREIAERVWQSHRGEPSEIEAAAQDLAEAIVAVVDDGPDQRIDQVQTVLEAADVLGETTELQRQNTAQAAIDVAASTESVNWSFAGRSAFDPDKVLDDADPTVDPLAAAALAGVRANSKVAKAIRADFVRGYDGARREFLESEMSAVDGVVATDAEVVDLARRLGIGARHLSSRSEFEVLVKDTLENLPAETEIRTAAIRHMRTWAYQRLAAISGMAVENARAGVESPFRDSAAQEQWRQWAGQRLTDDPFISTWAGSPVVGSRRHALDQAVEQILHDFPDQLPDVAAEMTSIDRQWLAADLHQVVHQNLPEPSLPDPHWSDRGSGFRIDGPGNRRIEVHFRIDQWAVSADGGASWESRGTDYRAAQGRAEELAGRPVTDPKVRELAADVSRTRREIGTRVRELLTNDELIAAVARSEQIMQYENVGAWSTVTKEAADRALDTLRGEDPELFEDAQRQGLDPMKFLRENTLQELLKDVRRRSADGGDLFSVQAPLDLHVTTQHSVTVGDLEGDHVVISLPILGRQMWIAREAGFETPTLTEAIALARTHLAEPRADQVPAVEAPLAVETPAPEVVEVPTPAPIVEPTRNADGSITWTRNKAAEYAVTAGANAFHDGLNRDEADEVFDHAVWVPDVTTDIEMRREYMRGYMQAEAAQHADEEAAEIAERERQAEDDAEVDTYSAETQLADAAEIVAAPAPQPSLWETSTGASARPEEPAPRLPQVPQSEMGEPLSKWRGQTLIEAERPDGSRVRVNAETLARYATPVAAVEAETVESPQVDIPTPSAPETVVAEPRAPGREVAAVDFTLGTEVLAPASVRDRIEANIAAIRVVKTLDEQDRNAEPDEQQTLARWSGWGGAWQVFDNQKHEWDQQRAELRALLTDGEFAAARRSTVNAHYTDPALAKVMWDALVQAGLPEQARVLEPGCGAGHFIGHAPAGVNMVGVELDAMTSRIAHRLYPTQQVRNHGFERDFARDSTFTATIGNVPFGDYKVYDDRHNPNGLSIHNHFIRKSLALTEAGGYVATITSAFTSDAVRTRAREEIAEFGDLVGAVRLPSKAFDRQAKTDVVTDLLIFRRREPDRVPTAQTKQWITSSWMTVGDDRIAINDYFQDHPENVLGTLRVGHGLHGRESLNVDANTAAPLATQVRARLNGIVERAKATGLALTAAPVDLVHGSPLDRPGLETAATTAAAPIPGTMRFDEVEGAFEQYMVGRGWAPTPSKGQARTAEWQALLAMGDTVLELVEASRTETTLEDRDALREQLGRQYDGYVSKYGPINRYAWTSHASRNTDEQARKKFPKVEQAWREANGEAQLDDDGELMRNSRGRVVRDPVEGELPEDVVAELWERAYTPAQGPYKKRAHLEGAIKYDPRIALVRGIERFNDDTLDSSKAAIFTEDVSSVIAPATSAATVDEAIAISFDETGSIDPARMAELLDTTVDDVLDQARGKIFPDLHSDEGWVIGARFLSGNVRQKLTLARIRADENPGRYSDAVDALAKVVPVDQDPSKIGLRPGAAWIGEDIYRQFLVEEFAVDDRLEVGYAAVSGSWKVSTTQHPSWGDPNRGYRDNWGLESANMSGIELFEAMCNNKAIQSYKTKEELEHSPKPAFHKGRTEELRDLAERLEERFVKWLWSDADRTDHLTRRFNDLFNSFVKVEYDIEHKQFPGLAIDPYSYQKHAAVRLIHDESILLDHCVGSGKTYTIAMSCMELKRLGQVQQPWVVVPNHLIDQWHREVLEAYPAANLLVASELADVSDRQRFMGQSATGDWDMVIVPESKFKLMSVSPDTEIEYIQSEVLKLDLALTAAKDGGSPHTVKEIEKALASREEQITKLVKSKAADTGLTFEQTGCDFLFVDEAHMYKNLARPSNSQDLSVVDGAQRATDMDMKINYLREQAVARNNEAGRPNAPAKAVAFATGTPVSNTMSELWVMKKYLRPDLLEELRMGHIDAWAQAFARQRTTVEMNVTGTQLRTVSRMAQYTNLPQMIAMVDQFRDVVVRDQIPVPLPAMVDGRRTIIEFGMGQDQRDFMHDLDVRMGKTTGKTAHIDNPLKIANDGRNASLHPRLANLADPDPEHDRVMQVAKQVWRVHTENAELHTPKSGAGPAADGVFQMIFCDRGTPKPGTTAKDGNLYAAIRDELVRRGMRAEEVAFIHDFPQAKDKQRLFADCRSGKVRVLIGSTEKMSTGVNAQRLLKALHHADCPYRPADLEQREGRIIRQGNVNAEVEILNYVAERSYDATMWQIVERKAFYIEQLRTGDVPHSMEDVGGEMALSAAQTKAAATGDPIYIQAVEKETEVKKLANEENSIAQINNLNAFLIRKFAIEIPILRQQAKELRAMAGPIQEWFDTDRDRRQITIGSATVIDGDSEKLADAMQAMIRDRYTTMRMNKSTETETLFEIAGAAVYGTFHPLTDALVLTTDGGIKRVVEKADAYEVMSSTSAAHGLMARVRHMLKDAERSAGIIERDLDEMENRLAAVKSEPLRVFTKGDELRAARAELVEMNANINARENSPDAIRRHAQESDRRNRAGQYEGWSLDRNPTRGHAIEQGMSREELVQSVPALMEAHAAKWIAGEGERAEQRRRDPWISQSADGSVFHLGADQKSGRPGARIQWTDRSWHWIAWDGQGQTKSDLVEQRDAARGSAQSAAVAFAKEAEIDPAYLYRRPVTEPKAVDQRQPEHEPVEQQPESNRTDSVRRPAWEAAQRPLSPPSAAKSTPPSGTAPAPRRPEHIERNAEKKPDEGFTR